MAPILYPHYIERPLPGMADSPTRYIPMEPTPDRRPVAFRRETVAILRAKWRASNNPEESSDQR